MIGRWVRLLRTAFDRRDVSPDEFHRLTRGDGGRLPNSRREQWGDNFQGLMMARLSGEREVPDPRLRAAYKSIYFDFVDNDTVNAVAFAEGARNFIGVFAGALPALATLCHAAIMCADVWPELEVPADEAASAATRLRRVGENLRKTGRAGAGIEAVAQPPSVQDARPCIRRCLFEDVFGAAVSFFLHHELAHVVRGHLDFFGPPRRVALYETAKVSSSSDDARALHWLELDADRFGIVFTLDLFDWEQPPLIG